MSILSNNSRTPESNTPHCSLQPIVVDQETSMSWRNPPSDKHTGGNGHKAAKDVAGAKLGRKLITIKPSQHPYWDTSACLG